MSYFTIHFYSLLILCKIYAHSLIFHHFYYYGENMKKIALCTLLASLLFAQEVEEKKDIAPINTAETSQTTQDPNALFGEKAKSRSGFVIGVFGGIGFAESDTEYYIPLSELEGSDRSAFSVAPSYGIKIGYDLYFTPSHAMRMYADYTGSNFISSNDIMGKFNTHTFALNVEYKYEITEKFGVFAGVNLNYTLYDTQRAGRCGGVGFGVNAGFTYSILSWLELEFGVKYLGDSFKDVNVPLDSRAPNPTGLGPVSQRVGMSDMFSGRLGLNFKI